jgi:hypothetical protein
MFRYSIYTTIFVWALGVSLAAAQDADSRLHRSDAAAGKVDVKSVVKIFLAQDTPGYAIVYEYDFPNRDRVYIKGLGSVRAKGSFRYLTTDKQIEVRDRPAGEILASVPLQETVIVAAKPPLLSTPQLEDFPRDFQTFNWDSAETLQERAQTVLNKYFHLVPNDECDKEVAHIRTTFTPLDLKDVSTGVTAQVALLLSFPCSPKTSKYAFQIQSRVMEGRTHSEVFRPTSDPTVVHSADTFVQGLVAAMKTGE